MTKKKDDYYYNTFIECTDLALQAANLLKDILTNFRPETLEQNIVKMHEIEHQADEAKHKMMTSLRKAFITPIEREDIIELSHNIDNIIDTIEDVLLRIYMCNIKEIRADAISFANLVVQSCEILIQIMKEFPNFKKTQNLKPYIIEVNKLEEEGDMLFIRSNYNLYAYCTDPIHIIAWRDTFNYLERCLDSCEDAADAVEAVIMKNL